MKQWILRILICFFDSIWFYALKRGWVYVEGYPYNMEDFPYSTVVLLAFIAIDSIKLLFVLKWTTDLFEKPRYRREF
ncbi:hypothetical protein LCGC14_0434830 [marine sediment metagenome]|uniref:Uncharacterized protein n=1 Tax=marine sediment metagenome TaxID=412755 RepID=A0A0F9V8Z5_9ZZZZ